MWFLHQINDGQCKKDSIVPKIPFLFESLGKQFINTEWGTQPNIYRACDLLSIESFLQEEVKKQIGFCKQIKSELDLLLETQNKEVLDESFPYFRAKGQYLAHQAHDVCANLGGRPAEIKVIGQIIW